jgi:hypothetical protein
LQLQSEFDRIKESQKSDNSNPIQPICSQTFLGSLSNNTINNTKHPEMSEMSFNYSESQTESMKQHQHYNHNNYDNNDNKKLDLTGFGVNETVN